MTCATTTEWGVQLERLLDSKRSDLDQIGRHCRTFAERAYSQEEFLIRFDRAFEAVGFSL
jgi:hypothetical protein